MSLFFLFFFFFYRRPFTFFTRTARATSCRLKINRQLFPPLPCSATLLRSTTIYINTLYLRRLGKRVCRSNRRTTSVPYYIRTRVWNARVHKSRKNNKKKTDRSKKSARPERTNIHHIVKHAGSSSLSRTLLDHTGARGSDFEDDVPRSTPCRRHDRGIRVYVDRPDRVTAVTSDIGSNMTYIFLFASLL